MEVYKKEIAEKEGLCHFYKTLDKLEVNQLIRKIETIYGAIHVEDKILFSEIPNTILSQKYDVPTINQYNGFETLYSLLGVNMQEEDAVYVVWNYHDVDMFSLKNLIKYWEYIWYGPSDECCLLYFAKNNLLVMPTDYGTVYGK